MSETIGRVRLVAHDADEFLGTGDGPRDCPETTHEALDAEVRRMLDEAEQRATRLVKKHREVLEHLVETLLDREAVEGEALAGILAQASP